MYSLKVLKVAAKESFNHILLLMAVIGGPIIYFSDGLDWLEKFALGVILLVIIWLLYLGLCFGFHRFSIRKCDVKEALQALDEIEKGKEVGSYLEGW